MELTVGPNQFFWPTEDWTKFYSDLATAPVDRVVLGELVCSKRLPFYQDQIPAAMTTLAEAGKQVVLTSLALVTLKRERKLTAELAELGAAVEVNDLTALAYLPKGVDFHVGPLINVYNEGTLSWLAKRGATRICLPPELPLNSVRRLTDKAQELGVAIEIWGHGRIPLAMSGRCYHARLHGRIKDNCQYACEDDPDGLQVRTLDDQPFLAMNGVQTLSETYACAANQIGLLADCAVSALRLSPQSKGFTNLCKGYRRLLEGETSAVGLTEEISAQNPGIRFSDGFLTGDTGLSWSGADINAV